MKNFIITSANVEKLKKRAKTLKQEKSITHTEALDLIAKESGFEHWHHVIISNKKIKTSEDTFQNGCVMGFDPKDGLDILSDDQLIRDDLLEIICKKPLYKDYCNTIDSEDPKGRTLKETLTPSELEEYFRDDFSYVFFRLSDKVLKENTTIKQIVKLIQRYSFWQPMFMFINGKLVIHLSYQLKMKPGILLELDFKQSITKVVYSFNFVYSV